MIIFSVGHVISSACGESHGACEQLRKVRPASVLWHRQALRLVDELKDYGGMKSLIIVDPHSKYATEHLHAAASRIEESSGGDNVLLLSRFSHVRK